MAAPPTITSKIPPPKRSRAAPEGRDADEERSGKRARVADPSPPASSSSSSSEDDSGEDFSINIVPLYYSHKYVHFSYCDSHGDYLAALIDVTDMSLADRGALLQLLQHECIAKMCLLEAKSGGWLHDMDEILENMNENGFPIDRRSTHAILKASKWCAVPEAFLTNPARIVSFDHVHAH
jgi:hypothetical protein